MDHSPRAQAGVYTDHMGHLITRAFLGLSPPSLTGAEAQEALEARSVGCSPGSGALQLGGFR